MKTTGKISNIPPNLIQFRQYFLAALGNFNNLGSLLKVTQEYLVLVESLSPEMSRTTAFLEFQYAQDAGLIDFELPEHVGDDSYNNVVYVLDEHTHSDFLDLYYEEDYENYH